MSSSTAAHSVVVSLGTTTTTTTSRLLSATSTSKSSTATAISATASATATATSTATPSPDLFLRKTPWISSSGPPLHTGTQSPLVNSTAKQPAIDPSLSAVAIPPGLSSPPGKQTNDSPTPLVAGVVLGCLALFILVTGSLGFVFKRQCRQSPEARLMKDAFVNVPSSFHADSRNQTAGGVGASPVAPFVRSLSSASTKPFSAFAPKLHDNNPQYNHYDPFGYGDIDDSQFRTEYLTNQTTSDFRAWDGSRPSISKSPQNHFDDNRSSLTHSRRSSGVAHSDFNLSRSIENKSSL